MYGCSLLIVRSRPSPSLPHREGETLHCIVMVHSGRGISQRRLATAIFGRVLFVGVGFPVLHTIEE